MSNTAAVSLMDRRRWFSSLCFKVGIGGFDAVRVTCTDATEVDSERQSGIDDIDLPVIRKVDIGS